MKRVGWSEKSEDYDKIAGEMTCYIGHRMEKKQNRRKDRWEAG